MDAKTQRIPEIDTLGKEVDTKSRRAPVPPIDTEPAVGKRPTSILASKDNLKSYISMNSGTLERARRFEKNAPYDSPLLLSGEIAKWVVRSGFFSAALTRPSMV
jgi:hypothetical protein